MIELKQQVKEIEAELERRRALHHNRGDGDFYYSNDVLNAGKKEVVECHACDREEEEEDEYEEIDEPKVGECLLKDMEDEIIEVAAATKELSPMEDIEKEDNHVAIVKKREIPNFDEVRTKSNLNLNDMTSYSEEDIATMDALDDEGTVESEPEDEKVKVELFDKETGENEDLMTDSLLQDGKNESLVYFTNIDVNAKEKEFADKNCLLEDMEKEEHNVVVKVDDEEIVAAVTEKEVVHEVL
ncbi:hypothetical protein SUGI_0479280 [Cryptomeria japonica]|nr:hypothetical protein SUGI_0479280 [Cryptomeria japonica]